MPIARFKNSLVFFSHIPKSGGTSIKHYLNAITNGKLAFSDRLHGRTPPEQRWSRSSPHHATSEALVRLFPQDFFDCYFAVCRHPIERFRSAFWFHQEVTRKIPADTHIDDFVAGLKTGRAFVPGEYDNHFQPQVRFLYPRVRYHLFRFEGGLDKVKAFIDEQFCSGPTGIDLPHLDFRSPGLSKTSPKVSLESAAIITEIYGSDFDFFRYQRSPS